MRYVNPVLPTRHFTAETLVSPRDAIAAFFGRVALALPSKESVSLDDALGRVLAQSVVADEDYPDAPRSAMDGFAVMAAATPGAFAIAGDVAMGDASAQSVPRTSVMRISTGGVLPPGADAVVPIEDARIENGIVTVNSGIPAGFNVNEAGADMRRDELVLSAGRRIRPSEIGVLATLGITAVPVYRRPIVAVLSSGDELVDPGAVPSRGQIRDSNRYAIAASLRLMGAEPHHFPTLRDEPEAFETTLAAALRQCDAVVVTGGSSVGHRDRLPEAVEAVARPGIVVHGMRLKPGKPTLLGAHGDKPILGLPGNPTSALVVLEAVLAPIIAALCGGQAESQTLVARLAAPARSRSGWTWYVPVAIQDDKGMPFAHPLALRSFSVSLTARAGGYIIMDECDEEWPEGTAVTVHRFLGFSGG